MTYTAPYKGETEMEFKPFLEVVAAMKDGDIADCANEEVANISKRGCNFYRIDELGNEHKLELTHYWFEELFKIRPRYVGWDEAEKAIQEGKGVEWHRSEEVLALNLYTSFVALSVRVGTSTDFNTLFSGKFIIQEDK